MSRLPSQRSSAQGLTAAAAEDRVRSPSFTRIFGEAPAHKDRQPASRASSDFKYSQGEVTATEDLASDGSAGKSRASYGQVEGKIHTAASGGGTSQEGFGAGVDINEAGRRNIHLTIQQCLETELENTTFAIRGDVQAMGRNMTNGTKIMLGEHIRSVASKFSDIIDAVDMRIRVAFDCYDEVAKEEIEKVDALGDKVEVLGKALNASKREYDYSQERLIADFSRKIEDERRLFNAQTEERQSEIKDNFADIQRAVMQMRETDRREVFDLVKEAHDTSQRVLMDHHDQVGAMHKDFEKRLARFQLELKEQHDANHAAMIDMMNKTVGKAEENQNNLMRQQREMVEQLTAFMERQDAARAADKAEILSLAGLTKDAAKKLHENSQENLVYVQEEVVDLRRKLFLQEQANYDLKREHSRLLQNHSSQVVPGGASSASVSMTLAEVEAEAAGGRKSPAASFGGGADRDTSRPFSPTEDSPGTLAAMSPSFVSTNPLKTGASEPASYYAAGVNNSPSTPIAGVTLHGGHNQGFAHGGSTQLSYNQHGLPDYANLKFGSSPALSPSSGGGLQEAKESPHGTHTSSRGRVEKPSSRARTPSPSPGPTQGSSSVRFKSLKASKTVSGNSGLVSNSPYIMSVSSDMAVRNRQMRDSMKPKPGQQY